MDELQTEEQQVEALKRWWSENGRSVIIGVVVGVSAVFGWRAWQNDLQQQAEQASELYQQLVVAEEKGQNESASNYGAQLIEKFEGTAYAEYSALFMAKLALEQGEQAKAKKQLSSLIEKAKEEDVRHAARIRLAQLMLADNDAEGVVRLLSIVEAGSYSRLYETLMGDAYVLNGKREQARQAYRKALLKPGQNSGLIQMKLDDLGPGGEK